MFIHQGKGQIKTDGTYTFIFNGKKSLNLTGLCGLGYHEASKFECEPDNFGNCLFSQARARAYMYAMARNHSSTENCIFTRREQWEYLLL
jgi:hypothetical protein